MSSKEAQRPGLVKAAIAGKITNEDGAVALGISKRHFRRLRAAYLRAGVEGLLHGNRGRPAANRLPEADRAAILERISGDWAGLNDCHLTEKLRELAGLEVSRETVRRLRREAGIAPVRRRRAPKHRSRRLREACEGTMALIDASEHAWFGAEHPRLNLLGAIDDATGKLLVLHFRPHEDLHGYTELLRRLVTGPGRPTRLYGDRLGVFVRNDDSWSLEEELAGEQHPTQFRQMLIELAIGYIAAHSPQAKGRIERLWATLQDRLVQELHLRGITTAAAAEVYLPEFIADYNRRFAVPAREVSSAWRRAPRDLERILACRYRRQVARDNTVSIPGRWIQLPPRRGGRSWHPRRVELRELLDGRLRVYWQGRLAAEEPWPPGQTFTLVPRGSAKPPHRGALGIDRTGSRPKPDRAQVRLQSRPQKPGIGHHTNRRRMKPDHPWKARIHRESAAAAASTGRT